MRMACSLLCLLTLSAAFAGDITWTNFGPGGGGWIQSLACDPRDPDLLYLGCDVGGFYLSRDSGQTWTIRNNGLADYFVECLAVHPQNSQILLLGTEGGIYKSTDQGLTWHEKRAGFPAPTRYRYSAPIGALCFDPTRPDTLYAGIGRPRFGKDGAGAVYRSYDCGETWKLATPPGTLPEKCIVSDLEMPADGSYLLAATDSGLFRSTDGAHTWQRASGLPDQPVPELAIAPSNPSVVYCTVRTTARDVQPWNGGVWRSDDGGQTWQGRSDGLATRVGKSTDHPAMTSGYKEIVVDPRDENVAYAGDPAWVSAGVYKTTNGGRSWRQVTWHVGKNMDYGWIKQWGPTVECLALSPARPDRVLFGTSGHVFLTDDGGTTWQQRYCRQLPDGRIAGTGLEVTCFNDAIPDPLIPGRVYCCYMDIGLLISDDRGATFRTAYQGMKSSGNCFTVARDPADRQKLWAATGQWGHNEGYICRSSDGGATWQLIGQQSTGLPCGQVRSLLVDPTSPPNQRRLYATCSGYGVYTSDNDGDTWACMNADLPEAAKSPCRLLMNPQNPKQLRLALSGNPDKGSGLHETRDGGQTWQKLTREPLFWDLKHLIADPQSFDTLYLCQREYVDRASGKERRFAGGLYRSTDAGATWTRLQDFHFPNCLAVSPRDSQTLYLATNDHPYHDRSRAAGLLVSRDGGKTWTAENDGLSHWNLVSVQVDPLDPSRLYLGTGGNSGFVGVDNKMR
ncbi:MAG: hypothetical protein ABFD94_04655 [Armatimonadia bacterium]